jgi:hypothetical protein
MWSYSGLILAVSVRAIKRALTGKAYSTKLRMSPETSLAL